MAWAKALGQKIRQKQSPVAGSHTTEGLVEKKEHKRLARARLYKTFNIRLGLSTVLWCGHREPWKGGGRGGSGH